eukprot:TRINITY_DN2280_c0_g1_i1.p1 TRINITY_DN2280_c0_g1~~TRINITY_DN2280_c0_g1_i1.p1  ORF type:complete len:221 (-),score=74.39 TRINITY_DN2280_c0_g1_i1:160-783(-)
MTDTTPASAQEPTKKDEEVTIEDAGEEEDAPPALEPVETDEITEAKFPTKPKKKQSKSEKKCRRAIQKLGMKPVPGIVRVTVKKQKNVLFVISDPDVFKSISSDTFVVFGEAKMDDFSSHTEDLSKKAKTFEKVETKPEETEEAAGTAEADKQEDAADAADSPLPDGIDATNLQLVMSQTQASRAKAIEALVNSKNDVVGAIMALSM